MKKQNILHYDRNFKIGAVMLSDEIGLKNAAGELGVSYYRLAYWRQHRGRLGFQLPWSETYYKKEEKKQTAKAKKWKNREFTMEERQRIIDAVLGNSDEFEYRPHEYVVDTTLNRAPEFYKVPDYSTTDPEADYKEGDFLYNCVDNKDAKAFFLRAAHAGIAAAQYELGCFYYYGTYDSESKTDLNVAEVWMKEVLNNKSADDKLIHCAEQLLQEIRTKQREAMLRYLPEDLQKQQQAVLDKEKAEKEKQKREKLINYAKEWAKHAGQNTTSKH